MHLLFSLALRVDAIARHFARGGSAGARGLGRKGSVVAGRRAATAIVLTRGQLTSASRLTADGSRGNAVPQAVAAVSIAASVQIIAPGAGRLVGGSATPILLEYAAGDRRSGATG